MITSFFARRPSWSAKSTLRAWAAAGLMAAAMMVSAAPATAGAFVDAALGDVKPEQKVVIANPQPVQLLFEFRTKGSPNARATKQIKPDVVAAVKASGLFSDVADGPTPNGAVLNVVIDDVVTPEDSQAAAGQGFVTGATFGLKGSTVRERYNCDIDYVGSPTASKISRTAHHSILVQIGLFNGTPDNAVKVDGGIKGAVSMMTRQIVSNPLNDLARDPGFAPTAAAPAPIAAPADASAPAAAPPSADAPKPQA
jgi:hypothetical protein